MFHLLVLSSSIGRTTMESKLFKFGTPYSEFVIPENINEAPHIYRFWCQCDSGNGKMVHNDGRKNEHDGVNLMCSRERISVMLSFMENVYNRDPATDFMKCTHYLRYQRQSHQSDTIAMIKVAKYNSVVTTIGSIYNKKGAAARSFDFAAKTTGTLQLYLVCSKHQQFH